MIKSFYCFNIVVVFSLSPLLFKNKVELGTKQNKATFEARNDKCYEMTYIPANLHIEVISLQLTQTLQIKCLSSYQCKNNLSIGNKEEFDSIE